MRSSSTERQVGGGGGLGFVAYSPLGRGFITGTAKPAGQYEGTDVRDVDPRWQPGNFEDVRPGGPHP
ncbi:hypothetical protein [Streptomyces violarus]|uniref:hypothetical protein n=1 Tax=Streptomyces violarus TaxID=67380 RepID=UPI003704B180